MADRLNAAAGYDLLAAGTLFLDLLYPPLAHAPILGAEQWVDRTALVPGACANIARAAHALGVSAAVGAVIGTGIVTRLVLDLLEAEGIATGPCRVVDGWDLPVTVGLPWDNDRALVTGGTPAPLAYGDEIPVPPGTRAVTTSLDAPDLPLIENTDALVFADVGFDPTGRWDTAVLRQLSRCYAFTPNADEAMAYTRTEDPAAAAKALANRVPLAVVTCGAAGYVAVDSARGAMIHSLGFPVPGNPTGAGDTFLAGLVVGVLQGLDAREALELGALAAAARIQGGRGLGVPARHEDLEALRRNVGPRRQSESSR